ncbi:MAG TPA: acyl-CoA reductase, partial [Bacteroidales bacterium]|nr:acyl-CoA reductase [Bacteroidales bacterium]
VSMLDQNALSTIAEKYAIKETNSQLKTVAVIMAGNVPLVGFLDFVHVLLCGHRFIGKLSHQDRFLLPAIAKMLLDIEPRFEPLIRFTEAKLDDFDAVIATGSDNSSRYFDYYFRKYPHIIRRNRHGVAIIKGNESDESLHQLGLDIFSYFGLGCRNVSTLFVPKEYSFDRLLQSFEAYSFVADHSKYFNNYEYYKSIFLINGEHHFDNGFVLIKAADDFGSPVAVLHYQFYDNLSNLDELITLNLDKIQCVVSENAWYSNSYPFGKAQFPGLTDYADGLDTIRFLLGLNE